MKKNEEKMTNMGKQSYEKNSFRKIPLSELSPAARLSRERIIKEMGLKVDSE